MVTFLAVSGRKEVKRMLSFLEKVQRRDLSTMRKKCTVVLVDEYVEELVQAQLISSRRVLTN